MDSEKRKRMRVGIKAPVVITQGETRVVSISRDISLKGLLAESREEIKVGVPCSISIRLSSGVAINIDAVAAVNSSRGTAFDFIRMDEDSFYHLHNLVKLHSMDPDRIDRELHNPAFDKSMLEKLKAGQ